MKQGLPTLQRLAVVEAKLEYRRKHLPSRLWHIPTPVATLAAIYHFDVEPIVVIPACWVAIAIAGIVENAHGQLYDLTIERAQLLAEEKSETKQSLDCSGV